MGPTSIGKTALSISLCKQFNIEIVSVDSVMIYKEFNIGSAKPCSLTLKKEYPDYLGLDDKIKSISENTFDISEYVVYLNKKDVNLQMLKSGYAKPYLYFDFEKLKQYKYYD